MRSILLLLLLISSPVYAIVVTGEGFTLEEAKQEAFKTAIDIEVGVIVDTESIVYNREFLYREILTYSAGFISDYEILEYYPIGDLHFVKLDITVASIKLKEFVLTQNNSTMRFDGELHQDQIESFQNERIDGDALIENFFTKYPDNAYNILGESYDIKIDEHRSTYMTIPIKVSWNPGFITSLKELISIFSEPQYARYCFGSDDPDPCDQSIVFADSLDRDITCDTNNYDCYTPYKVFCWSRGTVRGAKECGRNWRPQAYDIVGTWYQITDRTRWELFERSLLSGVWLQVSMLNLRNEIIINKCMNLLGPEITKGIWHDKLRIIRQQEVVEETLRFQLTERDIERMTQVNKIIFHATSSCRVF
jgi:hypothetical protein